jgi:lipoprotein Spr/probable lipoprotein NlpC
MQARLGKEVRKDDLRAGDLVFFRTGKTSNHVGIYLEKNKFLHASQKKGVIISRLDNVYWKSSYWKSVRI